jgi:CBS domain-containing protein
MLRANVCVEGFMTRRVVTITPDKTLLAAAQLMLEHGIGGLPVVDASGLMIGVFSESDLLREAGKGDDNCSPWLQMMVASDGRPAEPLRLDTRKVGDAMTREPVTIAPDASIDQACCLLHEHHLRRLPVVEGGKLVGVISRADLVRAVAASAEKASPSLTADVSVESRLSELERRIWRDRARLIRPF